MSLQIEQLHVCAEQKEIVHGVTLTLNPGEIHVIMGPNGSGKSTLSHALAGHPKYTVTSGVIMLDGYDITHLPPDQRAKRGLYLSFQYPPEIDGVSFTNLLRVAKQSLVGSPIHPMTFYKELVEQATELGISKDFLSRSVNVGLSGGEKKRLDMLQMAVLNPAYCILDEIDSGVDVDALRVIAQHINIFKEKKKGILIITHYDKLLEYIMPDKVHMMKDGQLVESGGMELARKIQEQGYSEHI